MENPKISLSPSLFLINRHSSAHVMAGSTSNVLVEPSMKMTGRLSGDCVLTACQLKDRLSSLNKVTEWSAATKRNEKQNNKWKRYNFYLRPWELHSLSLWQGYVGDLQGSPMYVVQWLHFLTDVSIFNSALMRKFLFLIPCGTRTEVMITVFKKSSVCLLWRGLKAFLVWVKMELRLRRDSFHTKIDDGTIRLTNTIVYYKGTRKKFQVLPEGA